jgi:hypothetical protein
MLSVRGFLSKRVAEQGDSGGALRHGVSIEKDAIEEAQEIQAVLVLEIFPCCCADFSGWFVPRNPIAVEEVSSLGSPLCPSLPGALWRRRFVFQRPPVGGLSPARSSAAHPRP